LRLCEDGEELGQSDCEIDGVLENPGKTFSNVEIAIYDGCGAAHERRDLVRTLSAKDLFTGHCRFMEFDGGSGAGYSPGSGGIG
jgi:hypothetical protein